MKAKDLTIGQSYWIEAATGSNHARFDGMQGTLAKMTTGECDPQTRLVSLRLIKRPWPAEPIAVKLPVYQNEKHAIRYVNDDDGRLHLAWKFEAGQVVAFEYLPRNYPSCSLAVFDCLADYVKACKEIEWIESGAEWDDTEGGTERIITDSQG